MPTHARFAMFEENEEMPQGPPSWPQKNWLLAKIQKLFRSFFDREAALDRAEDEAWHERSNFTKSEQRAIRTAIRTCTETTALVDIMGKTFPVPGHIFRLKPGVTYPFIMPRSMVLIVNIVLYKQFWSYPEAPPEVSCAALDENGLLKSTYILPLRIEDLEPVQNEAEYITRWNIPGVLQNSEFADGDPVETSEEILLMHQDQRGAAALKLPKGLKGVIETPEVQTAGSLEELNANQQLNKLPVVTRFVIPTNDGKSLLELRKRVFSIPRHTQGNLCHVYVPAYRLVFVFQQSQIKRRDFDRTLLDKVVMAPGTRQQILWLANSKEDDIRKWDIPSFQKGTGKVFLAYGPPGTGKTMTGEALAEYLGRPLYLVTSADLGVHTSQFEENFKKMIKRTSRLNAVTVIDEAESILQSRDAGYGDTNARVTAVLRNLELLDRGIIWFTTNRPFDIDVAIESRIRSQIYFPFLYY